MSEILDVRVHDSIFQLHDNGGYTLLTNLDKAMQDSFMDKKKTKKKQDLIASTFGSLWTFWHLNFFVVKLFKANNYKGCALFVSNVSVYAGLCKQGEK